MIFGIQDTEWTMETVYPDGMSRWHLDGWLHREDGPAIVSHSSEYWYHHGQLHREDGPAIVHPTGDHYWYSHGVNYTPRLVKI